MEGHRAVTAPAAGHGNSYFIYKHIEIPPIQEWIVVPVLPFPDEQPRHAPDCGDGADGHRLPGAGGDCLQRDSQPAPGTDSLLADRHPLILGGGILISGSCESRRCISCSKLRLAISRCIPSSSRR